MHELCLKKCLENSISIDIKKIYMLIVKLTRKKDFIHINKNERCSIQHFKEK